MKITREFLQELQDEQGHTKGQIDVLNYWAKGKPWEGVEISDTVANFLRLCKGWRNGSYCKDTKTP